MGAADPTPLVNDIYYHYPLEKHNRNKVRDQATRLNKSLERIRRASEQFAPPTETEIVCHRDTCITVPPEKEANLKLRKALEEAEDACSKSSPPPSKKRRWFGWPD